MYLLCLIVSIVRTACGNSLAFPEKKIETHLCYKISEVTSHLYLSVNEYLPNEFLAHSLLHVKNVDTYLESFKFIRMFMYIFFYLLCFVYIVSHSNRLQKVFTKVQRFKPRSFIYYRYLLSISV